MKEPCERLKERLRLPVLDILTSAGAEKALDALLDAICASLSNPQSKTRKTFRLRILEEHGDRPICWICELPTDANADPDEPEAFSIDHVVPLCEGGGELGVSNLRPAHRLCNNVRHALSWPRKRVVRYLEFLHTVASLNGMRVDKIPDFLWSLEIGRSKSARKRRGRARKLDGSRADRRGWPASRPASHARPFDASTGSHGA